MGSDDAETPDPGRPQDTGRLIVTTSGPPGPGEPVRRLRAVKGDGTLARMSGDARGAILIFDGDCGFCTTTARWAQRRFRHGERAEPWQLLDGQVLNSFGLTPHDVEQAAWFVDSGGRRERGHRAVGRALEAGGGWRRVAGRLVLTPPTSWRGAGIYSLVVRWRHRLPGGTPACRLDDGH